VTDFYLAIINRFNKYLITLAKTKGLFVCTLLNDNVSDSIQKNAKGCGHSLTEGNMLASP
jgi:hypothetical protein